MAQRLYPDDHEIFPDQITFRQFVEEARQLYIDMTAPNPNHGAELTFLKFVLAGRRGLNLADQRDVALNTLQGLPPLGAINLMRDYDSLMGITYDLPYSVALSIWPVPPFREVLKENNHITALIFNDMVNPPCPPHVCSPNSQFP